MRTFRAEYVTPTGRLVSETQTALILALHFDMVPDEFRPRLLDALEKNIGAHKTHLLTGFIGTPFACLTLSENGRHDLAGRLLLQEDDPSWLYEVKMGATTIWERWNSIRPDGSFNPANMNTTPMARLATGCTPSCADWKFWSPVTRNLPCARSLSRASPTPN